MSMPNNNIYVFGGRQVVIQLPSDNPLSVFAMTKCQYAKLSSTVYCSCTFHGPDSGPMVGICCSEVPWQPWVLLALSVTF